MLIMDHASSPVTLSKYRELQTQSSVQVIARYHQLIEKQEYQDAASDLTAIFVEGVAPNSWWAAVVLCDSVQLLS